MAPLRQKTLDLYCRRPDLRLGCRKKYITPTMATMATMATSTGRIRLINVIRLFSNSSIGSPLNIALTIQDGQYHFPHSSLLSARLSIPICSLFRLFALHLAPAASALQLLKSGTLSFQAFERVPALTLSVATSRLVTSSRHSNLLKRGVPPCRKS